MPFPDLDTHISADLLTPASKFVLPSNRFLAKRKDKSSRRGLKHFIQPENAVAILPYLPNSDEDRTHCILRGDFVVCDLIPLLISHRLTRAAHVRIATLGLSVANAQTLARLVETGLIRQLTIVASLYFSQVDKATVFQDVTRILAGKATLAICRCHAKVILLEGPPEHRWVIEGSGNLRSSDNLEQMLILNDSATHDFHAGWIDDLVKQHGRLC